MCREARAAAPDITADELVWCIREKAEIVRRKKQSLGYLHTCVVNLCSPGELAQVRFRMAEDRAASNSTPSCKRCQRPLLDGHIDYICYACLEPS